MRDEQTMQILDLLHTMQEACPELYACAEAGNTSEFRKLCADMAAGYAAMLRTAGAEDTPGARRFSAAFQSLSDSLRRIGEMYEKNRLACLRKIEFELLPLTQEAYLTYYFFRYLTDHPEHLPEYYAEEQRLLCGNPYIDAALEAGQYRYELSISVLAYNKLEYTKRCVESLLANIPEGLNYELILINHGSTDGTKEYFESIHPHKQLDIAVNGGGSGAVGRIVEGEFTLQVSNDVLVTPHAIENLLTCIRSDEKIAWVVPTTPNISNLQTIPASYSTMEEMIDFARRNNRIDPCRWERRVRLCNPIDIRRNSIFYASDGLCVNGAYHTLHPTHMLSFPDDRVSLLLRRNGYKLLLAKDTYCHHYGSITLKDEIQQQNEQTYYYEGRQEFFKAFGVDPWGTGFCFDAIFLDRAVGEHSRHIDVLGINCGLGSNSLKIKEQLKEYCHNLDVTLYNITSEGRFMQDLKGISDQVLEVTRLRDFKAFLQGKTFSYIVWEEAFLPQISAKTMMRTIKSVLASGGRLFVKQNSQFDHLLAEDGGWSLLGEKWWMYEKREER